MRTSGRMSVPILAVVGLSLVASALVAQKQIPQPKAKVVLFLSTDCPVSSLYSTRIAKLAAECEKQGVPIEAYFPNAGETASEMNKYLAERKLKIAARLDSGAKRARELAVGTIPTAVVLDAKGQVAYTGAIDDNKQADRVKQTYLATALSEVLKGKIPRTPVTKPFGCILMPSSVADDEPKVTFARDIAPIIYNHCTKCHRPNETAPFNLTTYDDVKKWAPNIVAAVRAGRMPPWKAVAGYGEFHDANLLSETQKQLLEAWAEEGSPRGDAAKEPRAPTFSSEWALGTPDAVLTPEREFTLEPDGNDVYRQFVVKTNFKETVYVQAMDVRPGNRRVVHHVIAFLDSTGTARKKEAAAKDGQPGYATFGGPGFIPAGSLGGWAPGLQARRLPPGVALEIKPGTDVVIQVHYHKSGKEEKDRTKLGLYFAKEPVTSKCQLAWILNPMFTLKPGDNEAKVRTEFPIPVNVTAYAIMPHMHLLGKSMKATLRKPDGTTEPLVYVDDWDFNWQMTYHYKHPRKLPAGSRIIVEGVYDNSAANPRNPNNPPKPVRWGEETTDEMFLLIVAYSVD